MWLESGKLRIDLLSAAQEAEIRALQDRLPEWYHLSEKMWYAADMPDHMTFKIQHEGKTVGASELLNIRWYNHKAEMRFWLLPEARGRGLARNALKMLMDLAFNTLNFHRLEAEVYDFNKKAMRLIESLGFHKEGVLREAKFFNGRFHDIWCFGILRQEFLNSFSTD
jgi:RimJ/RimL family protein N-acetyltransferase